MEQFKQDIWISEGIKIPFKSLIKNEYIIILKRIILKMNLDKKNIVNKDFFSIIRDSLKMYILTESINESDGIKQVFKNLKLSEKSCSYLIWNYENVDYISNKDLIKYWDYIWYGRSDEAVLIYNIESDFILLVTDYGSIYY